MDFNIVVSVVGMIISIISVSIVIKKNNNNDGYFVGKVETKLDIIEKKLDEHNHYAEKIGGIEQSLAYIKGKLEKEK